MTGPEILDIVNNILANGDIAAILFERQGQGHTE